MAAEYFSNTRAELTPLVEKLQLDLGSAPTFTDRLRGQLGSVKAPLPLQTLAHPSLIALLRGDEVLTSCKRPIVSCTRRGLRLKSRNKRFVRPRVDLSQVEQAPPVQPICPSHAIVAWRCIAISSRCIERAAIAWMRCLRCATAGRNSSFSRCHSVVKRCPNHWQSPKAATIRSMEPAWPVAVTQSCWAKKDRCICTCCFVCRRDRARTSR